MSRPTLEVADIFRAQADNFINKHDLGVQQLKAIRAIVRCRTAALGGHVDLETTTLYLHLSQRHLQAVVNPVDALPIAGLGEKPTLRKKKGE